MTKKTRVKKYTRKDGTPVKGHTRTIQGAGLIGKKKYKYLKLIESVEKYDLEKLEPGSSVEFSVVNPVAVYDSSTGKPITIKDDILKFKLAVVNRRKFGSDDIKEYTFVDESKRFFTDGTYSGGVTGSGVHHYDISVLNGEDHERTKFIKFLV